MLNFSLTLALLGLALVLGFVALWRHRGWAGWLFLVASSLMLGATGRHADAVGRHEAEQAALHDVQSRLQTIRARLHHTIASDLGLLDGLAAAISVDPDLDEAQFGTLADQLLHDHHRLRNLAAAPGLVVRYVHPLAGNEVVLGLDYKAHPVQRQAALRALRTRRGVFTGPVDLIQGGRGFIARTPVILPGPDGTPRDGEVWGLLSTVVDVDELMVSAGASPDGTFEGLDVAMRWAEHHSRDQDVFLGPPELFGRAPAVILPLDLPGGGMELAARPAGGWHLSARQSWAISAALFGLWLALIALFSLRRRLSGAIARAEQSQAERARTFREMFTESVAPMILVDVETAAIVDANAAAGWLCGCAAQDLLGRHVRDLDHADDATVRERIDLAVSGQQHRFQTPFPLPDGRVRQVEVHASPVTLPGGRRALHTILQDRTSEQEAHEQLLLARDAAVAAARVKDAFLANMSHEIRTPMNGILGAAQLIRSQVHAGETLELVDLITSSGQSLQRILDDVLDHAKLTAGRVEIDPRPVQPRALVQDVATLARANAAAKGLVLAVEICPDVPEWVQLDGLRARQVLTNLLSNAVKFTEHGGVTIRVHPRADATETLIFEVEDSGIGMTDEESARIFLPFEQAEASTTQRFGGTGLGTTISRELSRLMGGELSVRSVPGTGSTFTFAVPAPAIEAPSAARPVPVRPVTPRDQTVLIAEDNAVNARIATLLLQSLGYAVLHAPDGQVALELADRADVVFMDIRMPVMDGVDATLALRARGYGRPIIALTANVMPEDQARYLASGFDRVLGKPFQVDQIAAVLTELLDGASPLRATGTG